MSNPPTPDTDEPRTVLDQLLALGLDPCEPARVWLAERTDYAAAWRDCPDGAWGLWLIGSLLRRDRDEADPERVDANNATHKLFTEAVVACARKVAPLAGDRRRKIRQRIEAVLSAVEAWNASPVAECAANPHPDPHNAPRWRLAHRVSRAVAELEPHAEDASRGAAQAACFSAVYAGESASVPRDGSAAALYAAEALAYRAAAHPSAEYYAARAQAETEMADLVRSYFPEPPPLPGYDGDE